MTSEELIESLSIKLAAQYRSVIEPAFIYCLDEAVADGSWEGERNSDSVINYTEKDLQKIRDSNSIYEVNDVIFSKILGEESVEPTMHKFDKEELLTIGNFFSQMKIISFTLDSASFQYESAEVYYPCEICEYKVHLLGDWNDYCHICKWDYEKSILGVSRNYIAINAAKAHFEKHGVSIAGLKLYDINLFFRWLHDIATGKTKLGDFFEYKRLKNELYA